MTSSRLCDPYKRNNSLNISRSDVYSDVRREMWKDDLYYLILYMILIVTLNFRINIKNLCLKMIVTSLIKIILILKVRKDYLFISVIYV